MPLEIITSSIYQGLLWSIMGIGVYLTFRILDIADMTAEGSFPLGAAVSASCIVKGMHPLLATLLGLLSGMLAGFVSGVLHTKFHIPALLTGILTMTGLYSINLFIMGQANISLLNDTKTIFQLFSFSSDFINALIVGGIIVAISIVSLVFFFNTEMGLAARAVGDNSQMAQANGVNIDHMKIIVYMFSNGLISLSGSLMAQMNGYADISMGIGTIVIALAAIIIAEILLHHLTFGQRLMTIILGAILYRFIIALVLELGVDANALRLLYAIMLAIFLSFPLLTKKWKRKKERKWNQKEMNQ